MEPSWNILDHCRLYSHLSPVISGRLPDVQGSHVLRMEEITFTGYISITLRVKIITVLALYKINDCAFHITIKIYEYCKSKEKKSSSSIQQGCCQCWVGTDLSRSWRLIFKFSKVLMRGPLFLETPLNGWECSKLSCCGAWIILGKFMVELY